MSCSSELFTVPDITVHDTRNTVSHIYISSKHLKKIFSSDFTTGVSGLYQSRYLLCLLEKSVTNEMYTYQTQLN